MSYRMMDVAWISAIARLYGLETFTTDTAEQYSAAEAAVADFEKYFAVERFDPFKHARQIMPADFGITEWWLPNTKHNMIINENTYVLIFRILFVPFDNYNPIVNCKITCDGIMYPQVSLLTSPHPKSTSYYLSDVISAFSSGFTIRPEKQFTIEFQQNDFIALPVGVTLTTHHRALTVEPVNVPKSRSKTPQLKPKTDAEVDGRIRGLLRGIKK